ncbi:MAG: hypothetical protein ACRBCJ_03875 [Hyphomicrobiaceae bacterium]
MIDAFQLAKPFFAASLTIAGVALVAAGVGHACSTCNSSIELSKRQLACIETFLPVYLAEPVDPVIVSLLECSQPSGNYTTSDARSDTILDPIVDPEGDKHAADKVYFLTKKQIRCLQDNISELKQQDGQPVVFRFSDCQK